MERVGVAHLADRDARRLSMGERQLVFVAIALAQAAPILVLDEPTAHLDIRHQVEVMQLLVDLNERDGRTIVAVLHDLALAANFFPRVALMSAGRIVADGPPDEHARCRPHPGRLRGRSGARPASRSGRRSEVATPPGRIAASAAGSRRATVGTVRAAFALLTRLPVGATDDTSSGAAAFPLVGAVVGLRGAVPLVLAGADRAGPGEPAGDRRHGRS